MKLDLSIAHKVNWHKPTEIAYSLLTEMIKDPKLYLKFDHLYSDSDNTMLALTGCSSIHRITLIR